MVRRNKGRNDFPENRAVGFVVGMRGKRHVDVEAPPGSLPNFVFKPAPGEKRFAAFVQRHGEYRRIAEKGFLRAVAMVHVEVEAKDLFSGPDELFTGNNDIVDIAKPAGRGR